MAIRTDFPLYWTKIGSKEWSLHLAASPKGVCFIGSLNEPFTELTEWAAARFPGSPLLPDEDRLRPYTNELLEYLQGSRKTLTIPLDYRGTPFQLAVWSALLHIPYGQTVSYSAIAEQIQRPSAARAVGAAIGANPVLIAVPCHRVIGKNGALTGYRGGMEMKTRLLRLERNREYSGNPEGKFE